MIDIVYLYIVVYVTIINTYNAIIIALVFLKYKSCKKFITTFMVMTHTFVHLDLLLLIIWFYVKNKERNSIDS